MIQFNSLSENSTLEVNYISFLNKKNIKYISFDIFDTVLFREVAKPIDIFKLVGSNLYVKRIFDTSDNFQQLRIQAERKAREKNKLNEISLGLIYDELNISKSEKEYIKQLEIEEEFKNLKVNKQILKWIDLAKIYNKKIILISDMYLDIEIIRKLIKDNLYNYNSIEKIFVSSEYNETKYNGRLYDIVLKEIKILPEELIHIGDNFKSDIEVSRAIGINSIYYNCDKYLQNIFDIEDKTLENSLGLGQSYRVLSAMLNPFEDDKSRFYFNLGASVFGPIMWEFSHWVNKIVKDRKINQINCVMREGRIFKKYISMQNQNININLVYASRKSTYLSSVDFEKIKKNGLNFYDYRQMTIENFYDLFKIIITNKFIKEHKSTLLKNANNVYLEKTNLLDLISEDFFSQTKKIKKNIKEAKDLLSEYLQQLKYTPDSVMIDFGGRGTILKNIKNSLPLELRPFYNILFYMPEAGYSNMCNEKIFSFIPYSEKNKFKIELIKRSPEFIEILFNGLNKTTIEYKKIKNEVFPILDVTDEHTMMMSKEISSFDEGINAFFSVSKEYEASSCIFKREDILSILVRLINIPLSEDSKYLGSLLHNEGYGSRIARKLINEDNILEIKKNGLLNSYFDFTSNMSFKNGRIPWVQGVISQIDEKFLLKVKGFDDNIRNKSSILNIIEILKHNNISKPVYIYGAGDFFIELETQLKMEKIIISNLIDSRAVFSDFSVKNYKVKTLENVGIDNNDTIIVSSEAFAIEITDSIMKFALSQKITLNIINYYNGLIKI